MQLQTSPDATDNRGQATRSSDRVPLGLTIIISGADRAGRKFEEKTQTLMISRRGAKIFSREKLSPRQVLAIQCLKTNFSAAARVVGPMDGPTERSHFGIAFLRPEVSFWGVSFPLLDGTETAAGRIFLECSGCQARQVAHLDSLELRDFVQNESLSRPCLKCERPSVWRRAEPPPEPIASSPEITVSSPRREERKSLRYDLKVKASIRNPELGGENVTTENLSEDGFRFLSSKNFRIGMTIEAAIPYSEGAINIFSPAKIVHRQLGPVEGIFSYGVAYLPSSLGPVMSGMRLSPVS